LNLCLLFVLINFTEARKKAITPSVPMKPLYWKRIQIKELPPSSITSIPIPPSPSSSEVVPR
jgi:hypothetical protein